MSKAPPKSLLLIIFKTTGMQTVKRESLMIVIVVLGPNVMLTFANIIIKKKYFLKNKNRKVG